MPLNFPNSPTTGQTYTYNGLKYTYNGSAWVTPYNGGLVVDIDSPYADIHANINRLPFEDGTVDCIIAFGSLIYGDRDEHLGMDGNLLLHDQLKEISRVLRSGGLVYGRTRYLDILSEITIDKYEQEYGFKRMSARTILHVKSGEKRLYWEWVKY